MGPGCHLSNLPTCHTGIALSTQLGSKGVVHRQKMGLLIVKAFLVRKPPVPNPERIHTVPF